MSAINPHIRREFSQAVKLAAWNRCKVDGIPHCEQCRMKLVGRPEYDHVLADGLYGEPILKNCMVMCSKCHRIKTDEHDRPLIAKADRIAKKDAGITRKRPWPKSRGFEKRWTA